MSTLRFHLLQARTPDEAVRTEEIDAFATMLGVPPDSILPIDLLQGAPSLAAVTRGVDGVLVGGSGRFSVTDSAPWIPGFIGLLGQLAERDFPTFASCFGFQGLVVALGGEVKTDPEGAEVGSQDLWLTDEGKVDPLFSSLPERFVAQQGHKDRATHFPDEAIWLARSLRCPYQALRVGEAVYATQFHPELDRDGNRTRFARYAASYGAGMTADEVAAFIDGFRPSPGANGLLRRFADGLRGEPPRPAN